MPLTPWDNSAWRPDFSATVAEARPPTLHGEMAPAGQVAAALALARRALWMVLEDFSTEQAIEHLRAMAEGDRNAVRLAQDFLGFTTMSTSSRGQTRAFFVVGELRSVIDRPPARSWWRRIFA